MKQSLLLLKFWKPVFIVFILLSFAGETYAGGPWVLGKGQAGLSLGFSRKVGKERWSHFHNDPNGTPKNLNDDVDSFALTTPKSITTVDGKFHDFRYYYFQGAVGICKNLEINWTLNWLEGREAQTRDPYTGQLHTTTNENGSIDTFAVWELNNGFTDSWVGLKYQFHHGKWPLAIEINSRIPDLYQQPGEAYTRFNTQYVSYTFNDIANDTSYTIKDTIIEAGSEWRGLNGRDIAFVLHAGHSFFEDGALYVQGFLGYNWRRNLQFERTAYADQLMIGINGGYNFKLTDKISLIPALWVDYIGGIGNGGQPVISDRFYSPYKNNNFNNSKTLRGYVNMNFLYDDRFNIQAGLGKWFWGRGAVKYTEMFVQLSYLFGKKC